MNATQLRWTNITRNFKMAAGGFAIMRTAEGYTLTHGEQMVGTYATSKAAQSAAAQIA